MSATAISIIENKLQELKTKLNGEISGNERKRIKYAIRVLEDILDNLDDVKEMEISLEELKKTINIPKFIINEEKLEIINLGDDGAIIDIETTDLDCYCGEMVAYSIIRGNKLKQVCRGLATEEELLELLKRDLEGVKTIYSYTDFELDWIKSKIKDMEFEYVDLFSGLESGSLSVYIRWKFRNEPYSSEIPERFERVQKGDFFAIEEICSHNRGDALRKLALLILRYKELVSNTE